MLKKSIKYLIIALLNLILLTILLAIWTDEIELTFNLGVRPIEFLKIIGITLLALIIMRIAVEILFRKFKIHSIKKKIGIASLITLLVSSALYYNYLEEINENRIQNKALRNRIALKIMNSKGLAYGTRASNLTYEEYQEISNINWFPKIQKEADSISYYYTYDGFLPDYSFGLSYNLPNDIKIDSSELKYGTIKILPLGLKKRVSYSEYKD